uniref:Uncharacterized protein n=1 Tax=Rhipicephalus zambeziensis TaxID=60191 RepID=A0A224YAD2_9ACAR
MRLVTGKKKIITSPTYTYDTLHTTTVPPRGQPRSMHPMRGKASPRSRIHLITNVRFKPGSVARLVWDEKQRIAGPLLDIWTSPCGATVFRSSSTRF